MKNLKTTNLLKFVLIFFAFYLMGRTLATGQLPETETVVFLFAIALSSIEDKKKGEDN